MRCRNCGHDAGASASFCLNCGTHLGPSQTGATPQGLPGPGAAAPQAEKICGQCGTGNAPHMRFCRQCGGGLSVETQGQAAPPPQAKGGIGGRTMMAAAPPMAKSTSPTPPAGVRAVSAPHSAPVAAPQPLATSASAPHQICGHCSGQTPTGFAFCQRCGKPLSAAHAPAPQASVPVPSAPVPSAPAPAIVAANNSATESADAAYATHVSGPPIWGQLISVNRDGTDGQIHGLFGENSTIGSGVHCDLRFDDSYLAPIHARVEKPSAGGVRIVPIDRCNGVFAKLREDTIVEDGDLLLVGRELLRFESLHPEEAKPGQLMQHGVALFGSPLREAWGRLVQLLPSGGIRDIRHLMGEEVIIGREEGDLVFADDEFLSRRHAALRLRHGQCVLSDLGSSNGSYIRLKGPAQLSDGSVLRVGDQLFRFKPL